MAYIPTDDKIENTNLSINIQENKVIILYDGAYSSLDIEEDDIFKLTSKKIILVKNTAYSFLNSAAFI